MKQEIEKLIKENQIEVAITLGAVRLENIGEDDLLDKFYELKQLIEDRD